MYKMVDCLFILHFTFEEKKIKLINAHLFQNVQASDTQQMISMGRAATQSNIVPQIQGYTSVQKVAPHDSIVPLKPTQQHAKTTVFNEQTQPYVRSGPLYGQFQTRVQKIDMGEIHSQKSRVQNGQTKQCATTAKNRICPSDKKNTEKRRKKRTPKTINASQGSQTAPNVDNYSHNRNNPEPSVGLTTTHHVTTGDHYQNSPTNQPVSMTNPCFLLSFVLRSIYSKHLLVLFHHKSNVGLYY